MMKRFIIFLVIVLSIGTMTACKSNEKQADNNNVLAAELKDTTGDLSKAKEDNSTKTVTISGSFSAYVQELMPDYVLDDQTPRLALVRCFQRKPFIIQLSDDATKDFTEPGIYTLDLIERTLDTDESTFYQKNEEYLKKLGMEKIINLFPHSFEIGKMTPSDENNIDKVRIDVE